MNFNIVKFRKYLLKAKFTVRLLSYYLSIAHGLTIKPVFELPIKKPSKGSLK
jgi:CRISPR/Cas system-associated protein endoribonuclease Cas2